MERGRADSDALSQVGEQVAADFRRALIDSTRELDPEVANTLVRIFNEQGGWPSGEFIAYLEGQFPGVMSRVMERMEEVAAERRAEELAQPALSRVQKLRAFGRGMLGIIGK